MEYMYMCIHISQEKLGFIGDLLINSKENIKNYIFLFNFQRLH